jgi:hypothetical protein
MTAEKCHRAAQGGPHLSVNLVRRRRGLDVQALLSLAGRIFFGHRQRRVNSASTARKIKDCDREAKNMRVLQPGELNIFLSLATARAALGTADPSQMCRSFKLDTSEAAMCSLEWTRDTTVPIPELKPIR